MGDTYHLNEKEKLRDGESKRKQKAVWLRSPELVKKIVRTTQGQSSKKQEKGEEEWNRPKLDDQQIWRGGILGDKRKKSQEKGSLRSIQMAAFSEEKREGRRGKKKRGSEKKRLTNRIRNLVGRQNHERRIRK